MSHFTWGTLTGVSPLRVQLDGDTAALPVTPDSLVDPLTLAVADRVRCELSKNRVIVHGRSGGTLAPPVGSLQMMSGRSAPSGYLKADGTAVSRTTYSALFAYLVPTVGVATITIASPGVITRTAHGLVAGDKVYFTTSGALPTGLVANTLYYVLAASLTANTFRLGATAGGAAINTSGSQSGVHTLFLCPYGLGNGSTTFNVPDFGDYAPVGQKDGSTEFGFVGASAGAKTHTLTLSETPNAPINVRRMDGDTNDYLAGSGNAYGITTPYTAGGTEYNIAYTGGGGQAHNNLQPSRAVLFVIKT